VVVVIAATWEYATASGRIERIFFSQPTAIYEFLYTQYQSVWFNAVATFEAAFVGFVIASASGILTGLALGRFSVINRLVDPWVTMLNSLPRIALVPLFILWFGISFQGKVAVVFSLVYFLLIITTRAAVTSVDPDLVLVSRLLCAKPYQLYLKVVLPAAVPGIFAGLRLGVSYSLLAVISSEMIASRAGLGNIIVQYGETLRPAGVFGTLLVLALLAAVIAGLLRVVERRFLRWHEDS
jgi:NitT/TauT family transport system permease protein